MKKYALQKVIDMLYLSFQPFNQFKTKEIYWIILRIEKAKENPIFIFAVQNRKVKMKSN